MFKVVLLGEGRVGKTSLISRFVNDKFDSEEVSTVQASMYNKKRVVVDGRNVDLSIWDTAGQERFHALGPIYYRNSNGAVLVYDITDADTFDKVKMWIKELKAVVGEQIPIVICGNKADMERERDMDEAAAVKYAKKENAQHFNTSAKLNMNVAEAFEALGRAILAQEGGGGSAATGAGTSGSKKKKKGGLRIDDTVETPESGASSAYGDNTAAAPPAAGKDSTKASSSYDAYDAYDEPPKPQPSSASNQTKPRKNTIVLSDPPASKSTSSGGGSSGGGGASSSSQTKKKEGKCCS